MKLHLAPIQGMTNAYYRNLYNDIFGGIDQYYAPFVSTTDVRKVGKNVFKDLMPDINTVDVLIPQILGNNGEDFKHYAKLISQLGYQEINWNIGCPYPTVAKKKKGSGILPYADLVRKFMDSAIDDAYTMTVKMRLGYEDLDEGFEVMEVLNDYPIGNVTIHGRTGLQRYEGTVDLDAFEALYKTSKHEVIYNGDIYTLEDFNRIQARFPDIQQFMLGRGALRDPFLPAAIKGEVISQEERPRMLRALHDGVYDYFKATLYGDKHLCDKMKEFWVYNTVHLDNGDKYLKKLKKCRTDEVYNTIVQDIFTNM